MTWLFRTLRRSEQGQAVVELALALPVLLLILLGILDFGRALNTDNTANHLANLGARFAAAGSYPGQEGQTLCQYIDSTAAPSNLKNKLGVVVTEASTQVGSPVEVHVTNSYHWLAFIQDAIKTSTGTTSIVGEATMRLENTANGNLTCSITTPS
jgi:Flp pilus assembly protein TadG